MSMADRIKHTRNAAELAWEMEPMAQAMVSLSDDLKQTLEELRSTASSTRSAMETGSTKLNNCTDSAVSQAKNIERLFTNILQEQRRTTQSFTLTMGILIALVSLISGAGAGIGLWIWQQPSKTIEKEASYWNEVATRFNSLDPEKKHQFRQLMNWPEPKAQETKPRTGRPKRLNTN